MGGSSINEYETFEYKHFDELPLQLEDAIKQAAELRISDGARFHRIVPSDSSITSFRVESVSPTVVYYDLITRWSELLGRAVLRSAKR